MPVRIQRLRTKGYRAPEGAIYVGRPSQFGNPFLVNQRTEIIPDMGGWRFGKQRWFAGNESGEWSAADRIDALAKAVELYREWIGKPEQAALRARIAGLRGHDLMCWCNLGEPCHADVLLELANR